MSFWSATPALAQSVFSIDVSPPVQRQLQDPASVELHSAATLQTSKRQTNTIALPGTEMNYAWDTSNNKWVLPPVVYTFNYDNQGQLRQMLIADSAATYPKARRSYHTASADRFSDYVEESWTGTAWVNARRQKSTYDSQNRVTERLYQNWVNGTWQNDLRYTQSYDAQGRMTTYAQQRSVNGVWKTIQGWRTTFTYNAVSVPTKEVNETWDTILGDYVFTYQYSYSYNADGRMTQEVSEYWSKSANTFVPSYRYMYAFSGAGLWSEYVGQEWKNNAYVNKTRVINPLRDAQNELVGYEQQTWNGSTWQPSYRITITFPVRGSSQELTEDFVNGNWVNERRRVTVRNDGNELIEDKEDIWLNGAWVLAIGTRILRSYDDAGNLRRRVDQNCNSIDKGYRNIYLYTYGTYQTITLANRQAVTLTAATQIYPNPATDKATLQLANLLQGQGALQAQLLNTLGQVVQRFTLKPQQGSINQELDLSTLKVGVYTLRIQTREGNVVKQIVRQ